MAASIKEIVNSCLSLVNNNKFIQTKIIKPIEDNWKTILKLASKEYDENLNTWFEKDEDFVDKKKFMKEIKPTTIYMLTDDKKKEFYAIDMNVASEKLMDRIDHQLNVYIDEKGILEKDMRMEG